ncbi:MAG: DUF5320 domain-containing protein [Bacteroidales bacterium]|nr:DUF5320 domain-containing protein [Bacteroidales bacterium]MCF8388242.1 DUF5320 domain-containing protein [Bacteroidales bacterium]MCF8398994.1 DUF5320 domain-containing protein [Bacteroidales bacterium]
MPGRDRTGPQGMGPMTGWRMGDCAGESDVDPGYGGYGFGRGRGFGGRGRGRGFRFGGGFGFGYGRRQVYRGAENKDAIEDEINVLKNQISYLEDQLKKKSDNEK